MAALVLFPFRALQRLATRACSSHIMESQITNRVMLIKPACFNYNPETAESNKFQVKLANLTDDQIQTRSLEEFKALASKLEEIKVSVKVFEDDVKESADAVFPNNWISFHSNSKLAVYPMMSECRRKERNPRIVDYWCEALQASIVDYSNFEASGMFLEGTGSMILDRKNKIAYACLSPRTHVKVLEKFCDDFGYKPVMFGSALSPRNNGEVQDVYHTNVMMALGSGFAVVCLDSIVSPEDRSLVVRSLEEGNIEIVPITKEQVTEFAGNVLQLSGLDGRTHLLMSTRAHASFTSDQLSTLQRHCDTLVPIPLDVIERVGGGGVRCMIAEVFPPISS